MGGGAGETLTGRQGVIEGGEAAACVQERRGLHGEAPEKGASPGKKKKDKPQRQIRKSVHSGIFEIPHL